MTADFRYRAVGAAVVAAVRNPHISVVRHCGQNALSLHRVLFLVAEYLNFLALNHLLENIGDFFVLAYPDNRVNFGKKLSEFAAIALRKTARNANILYSALVFKLDKLVPLPR